MPTDPKSYIRDRLTRTKGKAENHIPVQEPDERTRVLVVPPSKPFTSILHLCGHVGANVPCQECRQKNRLAKVEKKRAWREKRNAVRPSGEKKFRLPHLSKFEMTYDDSNFMWGGTLMVPNVNRPGGYEYFNGESTSADELQRLLGRQWFDQQPPEVAGEEAAP